MVCVNCEQWSYRCSWISERLADKDPRRRHSYKDPKGLAMYWFIVCRPDCQLNAVRHAFFRLEREAAETRWWKLHGVKRAVEEPQAAWNIYYANW